MGLLNFFVSILYGIHHPFFPLATSISKATRHNASYLFLLPEMDFSRKQCEKFAHILRKRLLPIVLFFRLSLSMSLRRHVTSPSVFATSPQSAFPSPTPFDLAKNAALDAGNKLETPKKQNCGDDYPWLKRKKTPSRAGEKIQKPDRVRCLGVLCFLDPNFSHKSSRKTRPWPPCGWC